MADEEEDKEPSFLQIDESNLDEAWFQQPRLMWRWGKKLAGAQLELDEALDELELVTAELNRDIREDPDKYRVTKVTEDSVKSAIPRAKAHKAAARKVREAKYQMAVIKAAVNALEHRKRALEKLVDLHGQQYFASPRTPKDPDAAEALTTAGRRRTARKIRAS